MGMDSNKGDRSVVLYSDNGIMQGKQHCKESELAQHIRELMWKCTNRVKIVVELQGK